MEFGLDILMKDVDPEAFGGPALSGTLSLSVLGRGSLWSLSCQGGTEHCSQCLRT